MEFPRYRKYPHGGSFFEILSETEFRELKIVGDYYEIHHIKASILPEYNYVTDLLNNQDGHYVEVDAAAFNSALLHCRQQLKPLSIRQGDIES
jgi:hypothetical protein